MAIIRCPECHHEISTLAPTCPFCGVNIAGNIITCPDCGKILLNGTETCPNCSCNVSNTPIIPSPVITTRADGKPLNGKLLPPTKKRSKWPLITCLLILILGCAGYFYYEHMKFENAMKADYTALEKNYDINSYISFLKKYPASQYNTEIEYRLTELRKTQEYWNSIAESDSLEIYKSFLTHNPQSAFTELCNNKIDSLEWLLYSSENTQEAYQKYLNLHSDGKYATLAKQCIENLDKLTVTPAEKDSVKNVISAYFAAINQHNLSGFDNIASEKLVNISIDLAQQLSENAYYHIITPPYISKIPSKVAGYNYVAKFQVEKHNEGNSTIYNTYTIVTSRMRIYSIRLSQTENI